MKNIIYTLSLLLLLNTVSTAQPVYIENFNFSVRDSLRNIGGWSGSQFTPDFVKVTSPGLTYSGYIGSGIGNCAYFNNVPNSNISNRFFGFVDTGTVYMSFLFKVESLTATATEGYNIALDESNSPTNLNTKFYLKKLTSTTFNIGIRKASGVTVYSPNVYNVNNVYLCVISYTFKTGSNNDVSKAFIFSSGVPATEPVSPAAIDTVGTDIPSIGDLILSNSFIQSGLQNSIVKIDGIRVGQSWNSVFFQNKNMTLNFTGLIQGFYNNVTNKMVKDTITVSLRYDRPPYSIAESRKMLVDSNGSASYVFNTVGNWAPYYFAVTHRNMLETWSRLTWEFDNDVRSFNFTTGLSNAYGSNMIMKGAKSCFYSGEIVHDGIIDVTDYQFVDNNSFLFATGYKTTDLNGDNFTDISDLAIVEQNSFNFVQVMKP